MLLLRLSIVEGRSKFFSPWQRQRCSAFRCPRAFASRSSSSQRSKNQRFGEGNREKTAEKRRGSLGEREKKIVFRKNSTPLFRLFLTFFLLPLSAPTDRTFVFFSTTSLFLSFSFPLLDPPPSPPSDAREPSRALSEGSKAKERKPALSEKHLERTNKKKRWPKRTTPAALAAARSPR